MVVHAVDQPGDGSNPCRVTGSGVAVHVRHRAEPAQPPDRVLDYDPTAAECPVVLPILGWALLPARLAARRRSQPRRVQRTHPDVTQITDPTDPLREPLQQP